MSLSKSKFWYFKNSLHFLKHAVPFLKFFLKGEISCSSIFVVVTLEVPGINNRKLTKRDNTTSILVSVESATPDRKQHARTNFNLSKR